MRDALLGCQRICPALRWMFPLVCDRRLGGCLSLGASTPLSPRGTMRCKIAAWNQVRLMTESQKATRATIAIGPLEVEGFMLPDGSYRMSVTSVALAIRTTQQNATNFLRSSAFKSLQGEGYTPQTSEEIEVDSVGQSRGQTRIRALPLDVAMLFWIYQSQGQLAKVNSAGSCSAVSARFPYHPPSAPTARRYRAAYPSADC